MARKPRSWLVGHAHHVLSRGNQRRRVFHTPDDYAAFLAIMREAKNRHPIRLLGYCLMPNHLHFVLMSREPWELSRWMHLVLTTHVARYRKVHQSVGHIWQGRFKSFPIEDGHILLVLRYVEANPVRAGLTRSAGAWLWSSHRERLGIAGRQLADPLPIKLPADWADYVDRPLKEATLSAVRQAAQKEKRVEGLSP